MGLQLDSKCWGVTDIELAFQKAGNKIYFFFIFIFIFFFLIFFFLSIRIIGMARIKLEHLLVPCESNIYEKIEVLFINLDLYIYI